MQASEVTFVSTHTVLPCQSLYTNLLETNRTYRHLGMKHWVGDPHPGKSDAWEILTGVLEPKWLPELDLCCLFLLVPEPFLFDRCWIEVLHVC